MNEFGEKFPLLKAAVEFLMRTNPEDEDTLDKFIKPAIDHMVEEEYSGEEVAKMQKVQLKAYIYTLHNLLWLARFGWEADPLLLPGFLRTESTTHREPEGGRVRQDARVAVGQRLPLRHHRPHCQGDQLGQAEGGAQVEAAGVAQSTDDEGGRKLRLGLVLHFEVLLYM